MGAWAKALIKASCAGWLAACAGIPSPIPVAEPAARNQTAYAEPEARNYTAYVVSHGWHTGVVLDRSALAESGLLPEVAHFPDARFLEFGWGDRDFYMTPDKTIWITLKAALAPTSAVMHVAPLDRPPREASRRVVRLAISEASLRRLVHGVSASFDRPEGGAAEPIEPGLRPGSRFYLAEGRFHLFNNCNTWTARVLAAAGADISPTGVVTAQTLMRQVREAKTTRWRRDLVEYAAPQVRETPAPFSSALRQALAGGRRTSSG
jgi:uncharacterized protein (TIGR02117 family)